MKQFILISTLLCFLFVSCDKKQSNNQIQNRMASSTNVNTSFKSGYSDVNGIKMYYEIHGQGYPLVLIHGGGSTIETTFGRVIPILEKHYQLIAVELQAHGRTNDRNTPISFEQDADDVAALLHNLKIEKANIVGFSNGGTTALQIAVRHPELCNKIIAGSALFKKNGTPSQFWEFMKKGTFEQMPQEYKDAFLKVNPDSTKLHNMFHHCANRMIHFKEMTDEQIKSVQCPVLLMNGDRDVATSEHMVAMSRLIPDCRLAIIPGGHGEYIGEVTTLKGNYSTTDCAISIVEKFLEAPENKAN